MSSTNIRNENSKSRASKLCMAVHSSTPIRNGEMESNIFIHLGPEIYIINLMLIVHLLREDVMQRIY